MPARGAWYRALACAPGVRLSGMADSVEMAEHLPEGPGVDVVLIEECLLTAPAATTVDRLLNQFPRARVVAGGPAAATGVAADLVGAGVAGYVEHPGDAGGLARALHSVHRGELALPRALITPLLDALRADTAGQRKAAWVARLSERELDVLPELLRGRSDAAIAAKLGVAESTVKSHVKRILRKAGARSRFALAVSAPSPATRGAHPDAGTERQQRRRPGAPSARPPVTATESRPR
jgi:DNA-binding NarL/FixJ family response regulator